MLHHFSTRGPVAWHVPHGVCWRLHGVCWRLHGRDCGVCFAANAMAHASGLWAWRVLALARRVLALAWQALWRVLCSKRHGTRQCLVAMACASGCHGVCPSVCPSVCTRQLLSVCPSVCPSVCGSERKGDWRSAEVEPAGILPLFQEEVSEVQTISPTVLTIGLARADQHLWRAPCGRGASRLTAHCLDIS